MIRRQFLRTLAVATAAALSPRLPRSAPGVWSAKERHAARRFAQPEQGRIAYVDRGAGQAAPLLHGYPLNGYQWRVPMAELSDQRRCIAPDLMGLGYSDVAADADLSPTAQVAMLLALLDHLKVDKVDVVANDSSTGLAQLLAAQQPSRIRSLLLTNGDVDTNSPPKNLLPFIEKARHGEAVLWFDKHVADKQFARSREGIGNAYHAPERMLTDELVENYFRPLVAPAKRRHQGEQFVLAMFPNPL